MGVIIGERLNRIYAERKKLAQQMEIKVEPKIIDVQKLEAAIIGVRKPGLRFAFNFDVSYGKNGAAGKIEVLGDIFYSGDEKEVKKLEADWKKEKKVVDDNIKIAITNRILELGYLQAIALANHVKLPAPLRMPRIVAKK